MIESKLVKSSPVGGVCLIQNMPPQEPDRSAFPTHYVALDLELHPETHAILKIGAIRPADNATLSVQGHFQRQDALKRLDDFCRDAAFLLGHNISRHDLPYLTAHEAWLRLCSLPLLDTLFLSPLAFPKNPYHRLVKDYKLVKQAVNNPVEDARCTISLFHDQLAAFAQMEPNLLGLYGRLLHGSSPHDAYRRLFEWLTQRPLPDLAACRAIWAQQTAHKVCRNQSAAVFDEVVNVPESAACLAYILAWVRIAGENSVLPPWVRHQFPQIPGVLDRLRGNACLQPDCAFCQEHHDPLVNLTRYFGFSSFRPLDDETPPLQQQVVAEIIRQKPCLAVLPTGYGKSVCYQLPALMKARQRNQLSLIISPLQSLMKDQVDGMKRKGILNVGTINGLLTMLERRQVLEDIRLGNVDLLWLAPEQLRNTTVKSVLKQREIGLVVIDEAHCFSKWGHDFRPDYLAIAKFLLELCGHDSSRLPQIACFTATAKKQVIEEIQAYFKAQLDADLTLFLGGHERKNLHYVAESVREAEKIELMHERLSHILSDAGGSGGGIVFAATRGRVEMFSRGLADRGWLVDYFHGARTPEDKRQVQERFLAGELEVIVATNAFGMGVDKPDVRVVIHADVPGSLENYLQEAGRAGRDGDPAWCFLLFNEEDLETQFKLSAYSRLEWRDMSGMLTGLKHLAVRDPHKTVILTSGELLRSEAMERQQLEDLSVEDSMYDTKVKTALSWLEQSHKVVRGDNRTQVIQGKVLVDNLQEAKQKIGRLRLSQAEQTKWMTLLEALLQADPKELLNTDRLSLATGLEPRELVSLLHAMREAGVINHDLNMTAYIHRGIANDSRKRFQQYLNLETSLLAAMQEQDPDLSPDAPCVLNLRSMSQHLKDQGAIEARPDRILLALDLMVADNLLRRPYPVGEGTYKLFFKHDWPVVRQTIQSRTAVCAVILTHLLSKLPANTRGKDLLVSFRSGELHSVLQEDMTTAYLNELDVRIRQGLLALHTIRVICLQSGLTVFRPAMTITVTADRAERFTKTEYAPLGEFYREKTIQVHIIGRYAELALESLKKAVEFVTHYFRLDRFAFLRLYFKDQQDVMAVQTTPKSYERIVTQLNNPVQEQIVTAPLNKNLLIVAGPGSGKTRALVHRIAYLIRVKRVPPLHILAIAFNRSAVTQLKLRLKALIGKDASWVRVRTYHSLAMAITGRSFRGKASDRPDSDVFREILKEAVQVLEDEAAGDHGALGWRDTLLSGLRFVLVDEYQDIDELDYRFLSLLAGRNEQESGRQPVLLAVGDDDQNIYAWKGSHVRFIRSFQTDYQAEILEMTENYRSARAIIAAANALIARNRDRMKSRPITPAGSSKHGRSPEKVTILRTPNELSALKAALLEARSLTASAQSRFAPGDICLLSRTNRELHILQILARHLKIPVTVMRSRKLPLTRTREFQTLMEALKNAEKEIVTGESLTARVEDLIQEYGFSSHNLWIDVFRSILQNYLGEILDARLPVGNFLEYVYDVSRDVRQLQQSNRKAMLLATMHTAKGMEFPVVMVVGQPLASEGREDERRLYYVAMTRAMQRLYCLHHQQEAHPFIREIVANGSQYVNTRQVQPPITPEDQQALNTLLWELELADVVISFPAYRNVVEHAQPLLNRLEPGTSAGFRLNDRGKTPVITWNHRPIARLSAKGVKYYTEQRARGYTVEKILFLAAIRWDSRTAPEEYQQLQDLESWYTGLFQIVLNK